MANTQITDKDNTTKTHFWFAWICVLLQTRFLAILRIGPLLEIFVQCSEWLYFFFCFAPSSTFDVFLCRRRIRQRGFAVFVPEKKQDRCVWKRKRKRYRKIISRAHKEVKYFCSPRKRNTFTSGFLSFSLPFVRKMEEDAGRTLRKKSFQECLVPPQHAIIATIPVLLLTSSKVNKKNTQNTSPAS